MTRAVVFDLYETLVDYDEATSRAFSDSLAGLLGQPQDEFARAWREGRPLRETGPLAAYLETLGLDAQQATVVTQRRVRRPSARMVLIRCFCVSASRFCAARS